MSNYQAVDNLNEEGLEHLHTIINMNFEDIFSLWVCMAEAMAEKYTNKFCTSLAMWAYQSIDQEEEGRWDLARQCFTIAMITTPLEMRSIFLDIKRDLKT